MPERDDWQLKARLGLGLRDQVKALARRRRLSISRLALWRLGTLATALYAANFLQRCSRTSTSARDA